LKFERDFIMISFISIHQWHYSPSLGPGLFFSFVIFLTQTVGLLWRVISPSQGLKLHAGQQKEIKHIQIFPWVGFEPTTQRSSEWTQCLLWLPVTYTALISPDLPLQNISKNIISHNIHVMYLKLRAKTVLECSFCRLIRRPGSFLECLIGRERGSPRRKGHSFGDHLISAVLRRQVL
jgi:hypothetical protein